jgi:hypothetical protein
MMNLKHLKIVLMKGKTDIQGKKKEDSKTI